MIFDVPKPEHQEPRSTPRAERERRIHEVLEQVNALDFAGAPVGQLSGGEQQRLAAARALVFKPEWLFMDEATASLDDVSEAAVYDALKRGLPGATMVSIGHRPALQKWHDRRLELQRAPGEVGRLVESALPAPA